MGKSKDIFLDEQAAAAHKYDHSLELGFIGRNNSAHYKGQELLTEIQTSRAKLSRLKKEIADCWRIPDCETVIAGEPYRQLVSRASHEKANLCSLLRRYAENIERMFECTRDEEEKELQSPVEPETRKSLANS